MRQTVVLEELVVVAPDREDRPEAAARLDWVVRVVVREMVDRIPVSVARECPVLELPVVLVVVRQA